MDSPHAADALVERLVAAARIPSRASRDDLRRELLAHFADAAEASGGASDAIRRFGAEDVVAESLRRVYRRDYVLAYAAKTAVAIAASSSTAILIQFVVSPAFSYTAGVSIAVALAVVTAWEVVRPPFSAARAAAAIAAYVAVWAVVQRVVPESGGAFMSAAALVGVATICSTLDLRPAKLLITLAAFAAVEYALHATLRIPFGTARAVLAGAIQLPVWASTLVIIARIDRVFSDAFETTAR